MSNCVNISDDEGLDYLRSIFPDGQADQLNFVLFSTSGIAGSYMTIEDVEEYIKNDKQAFGLGEITYIVICPRILRFSYGNARVTEADIPFLKKLRATSHEAIAKIGLPD